MKKLAKASSHGSVFIVAVIVSLSFALYVSYGASGNPSASVAGQLVANNNAASDNAALSAVTEMAVAPSVQILNNSFEAKEGVPLVVAFKVNSLANQKIDFAIATAGARLSTGLIEDNSISVEPFDQVSKPEIVRCDQPNQRTIVCSPDLLESRSGSPRASSVRVSRHPRTGDWRSAESEFHGDQLA
jgi:hypothetical protein